MDSGRKIGLGVPGWGVGWGWLKFFLAFVSGFGVGVVGGVGGLWCAPVLLIFRKILRNLLIGLIFLRNFPPKFYFKIDVAHSELQISQ